MTPADLATWLEGGSHLLLALALVGGYRGWYVWRREHDAMVSVYREEQLRLLKINGDLLAILEAQK